MNYERRAPSRLACLQGGQCRMSCPQRGLALVMVLWLIVLLGVIAGGHVKNVRIETLLASRHVELATARALADAGMQHAILQLLLRDPEMRWPVDGTVVKFNFNGSEIFIAIRDATGLIDLNTASADLLHALLAAASTDAELEQEIVGAILDWRDPDELTRLHGAEDAAYRASGRPWSARDGAFSGVEELRYVLGMTQRLFDDVAPFLTVYSERPGINLEFAPPFLITALTGRDVPPVAARRDPDRQPATAGMDNGTYHVYVSVPNNNGATASAEAVIRLSSGEDRPYSMIYWREPMRIQFPSAEAPQS